jgi:hypothetical protein
MATTTYGTEYVQSSDLVSNWPGSSLSVANRIDDVSIKGNGLNDQTGTSYTLILTDAGKTVTFSNASAITLTVPANASVAYPNGTIIRLVNKSTGSVTITGAGGVTVNGNRVLGTNQSATLTRLATDNWIVDTVEASSGNLLYNGAMQIAQRGTSTAGITAAGYFTADRYQIDFSSLGTWTQSVETDAPTGSGLRKSLKMLCTTADAAPAAGDYGVFSQTLEGQDLQRVAKGTASAQQLTASFWVKSNVTGTYILELLDFDNSRICCASYTISASATWEKKTITFPADTTGAFDNDANGSLRVGWWLGAGSTYTSGTLATTWATNTAANRAVGQTNLAAATNNYWQVTGVQLEVGPVASSFEFKSFGQELRECQRYYWRSANNSAYATFGWARGRTTTGANGFFQNPVPMRVGATSVDSSTLGLQIPGTSTTAITAVTLGDTSNIGSILDLTVASGLTAGTMYLVSNNNNASGYVGFSAEL